MLDVEIRNFQSIEHVHVVIDGFTTLVGRSNLGKSAIVRAIKAALTGAPEETSVRHGPKCEREVKGTKSCKCYCSVHIKTEGFDLLWEKGGDKNEYVFNGAKKTAVGKGTPDFLDESFGVVKIGEDKILLQVADQFKSEGGGPIFLLDQSGSVVADVLSDVAQLDRINVATRLSEKDRKEAIAQRKVREKDVMELKVRVTGYDGLDDVLARVKQVEADERKVAQFRAVVARIANFKEVLIRVGRHLKGLLDISKVPVPAYDPVFVQYSKHKALADYIVATESRQAVITELEGVDLVVIPSMDAFPGKLVGFQKLYNWREKFRYLQDFFVRSKTAEKPEVPEFDKVSMTWKKTMALHLLRGRLTVLEQLQDFLERFKAVEATTVPEIDSLQANSKTALTLGGLRARLTTLEQHVAGLEGAMAASDSEKVVAEGILCIRRRAVEEHIDRLGQLLTTVETEYAEIKAEEEALGVCPTCTQPVAGLVHEHAAE